MANKITESRLIPFNVQKGEGIPTHISPSGTLFFDTLSGVTYQNIDGLSNWSTLFGPTNKPQDIYVTGGTYDFTSGIATFRNNAGGSFTLFGFNVGGGGGAVFTGGTVVGGANFLAGLTSTTITSNSVSATTYYNLPTDIRVTGGTYSNGTAIFTNNTGGTFNLSGFTTPSSLSGAYLPLSGGTVSGNTIFNSGLTASTLYVTNYIDFNTGTTNPLPVGGRIFFDNTSKALSYYDVLSNPVPIAMGQQLYTRVYNATGVQIDKGKVVTITGTSNGLPSAALATNNHKITSARPIGLAAENIPNNSEGLILNNGILSGITLNTFANGDTLYLSDTVAGGYISNTSSLSFTARTNEIGYVIQTGSTTGKIYVNINNEDSNLSLTDIERNILEGNIISSGAYQYTGMTQGTGQTINVAQVRGWVVKNTYDYATIPDVTNVYYTGGTNIPLNYLNSADSTFILINSTSTLVQQTTFPTPQQRRENIFLGKVVHPNRTTITSLNQTVDFDVSPMAAIRDIWTPLKLINQGLTVSPNGANLSINVSSGTLWGNGIGWVTNQQNPDSVAMSGTSPTTFQYRSQLGPVTGATPLYTGNTTFIDTTNYDVGGVVTNVPGAGNYTTQRIYKFPTGLVRIQYGQAYYPTLAKALAELQNENFVEYSNNRDNGILIGMLTVKDGTTDLSNNNDAIFHVVSKFGELTSGSAGISTTTLQQAYNNSTTPEIVINATLDGLTIQNGTGNPDSTTHLLEGQDTAGSVTSFITAAGGFSGSSVSATTYHGLPTDIRTTGATYSNNTFMFTDNTGGTYNVLFNTVTGFTVNGNLTVTGNTSLQALTATTISATTISATTISSPFTTGSVIFQGSGGTLTQNNSKLFWDNTNNRFGLGTATPAYPFDAQHIGISGTTGRLTFRNDNNAYSVLALFSDGVGLTLQSHTSGGGYVSANNALNFTANDATNPTTIWVGNSSRFRVGNSAGTAEYLRISPSGNTLIGTSTDSGYKLDVSGTTRFQGNTTILALTGTTVLSVGGFNNLPELRFIDNNVKITRDSNGIMNFLGQYGAATNHFSFSSTSNLPNTLSAGTGSFINASLTFAPVSGNAVFNFVTLNPTINQTGTTSGITRGLYINPTLTSAYDYRAIETTAGKVIFGGANQIGTETAKLRVLSGYEGGSMNGLLVEANGNTYTSILRHTGSAPASLFIDAAQSGLTSMVRALYINGSSSLANYVTFAESGTTKFNISRAGDLTTSGSLYVTGNTTVNSGLYSINSFTGSFTDGIVTDYVTGNGRISVGTGDTITFYNGGVAVNPLITISTGGTVSANAFSGTSDTISGTKGTVTISGGSTTAFINVSGSNTIGGTGYTDFLRVTNTAAGTTNPTKTIRVNNTGGMEILNNAYTAVTLSIGDNGILFIGGGAVATTSNNDAISNYLYFNGNNSQIYDDGNMHIHSRGNSQSMWLNANNGSIILGNQSPVSGGGAATSIIMGSASTVTKAYVNIYGSKTYIIGSYGFLATGGAGTGAGTTAPYSLYCNNRVEASEFDATSDERLKDIQGEIELNDAINLVKSITPIKYFWKDSEDKNIKAGYSAQQVEKAGFRHLIGHIPNEKLHSTTDSDGFTSPEGFQLTMNYDQVNPYHGVVIKHLLEKIDELQKQIDELKAK
jgi:hypothetical protein